MQEDTSQRETQPDLPALYKALFEDDKRGAAILEDLHKRFGRVSVHTDGGIDAVLKTFKSGAQAAVIGYILNRIAQGNGDTPMNHDGATNHDD